MTPEQLKLSILQSAFQGKLIEDCLQDENAEKLYRQIQNEKQRLIKEKKIKKEKALPDISTDDVPFDIPENWKWCYVGDLFLHNTGKAQNSSGSSNGTIRKFITTSNLYWGKFDFTRVKEMPFTDAELERCTVKKGDLLVCEGGDCGRAAVWNYDEEVCIQNHIHRLRPYQTVNIDYFYYLFYLYKNTGRLKGRGVAIQGLSNEAIHKVVVPLAPLAEQNRIVKKIEDLLTIVERYAISYEKLEKFNVKFPEDMKKSILQYAFQGKLVEQRPDEGTAEELYQQLLKAKAKLVKDGIIKKEKTLANISEDEMLFDIPESWKWVRLRDLCLTDISYGIIKLGNEAIEGVKVLRCSDVRENHIVPDFIRTVEKDLSDQFERTILQGGEVVVNVRGTLGGCAVVPMDMKGYNVAREVAVIRQTDAVLAQYIVYLLMTKYFQSFMFRGLRGIAYKGLNMGTLALLPVPLPPLAEQKRIVAKIEELLPYCDRLVKEMEK